MGHSEGCEHVGGEVGQAFSFDGTSGYVYDTVFTVFGLVNHEHNR